jgi:hypothetical protein
MRDALPVIFRADSREVTAIFPTIAADHAGNPLCYAHVGQHSCATMAWVRQCTRPASRAEYAALLRELRAIYGRGPGRVRLVVRQKDHPSYRAARLRA